MKQVKRIISSLLILAVAFTFVITPSTASAKTMTVKQILTKSTQASEKAKNYDSTANVTLKMKSDGQPLNITAKCTMTSFTNPLKTKMKASVDTGLLGKLDFTSYVTETEEGMTTYLLFGDTWYKQTVTEEETDAAAAGIDAETISSLNNSAYKSFKVSSTKEKINGSKTYTLKGTISGKMIQTVIDQMDMDAVFAQAGLDSSIYNTSKNVNVKVWIDQKTMLPVKYTIDMTDYMSSVLKNMKDAKASVSKYTIAMTFKNYNKAKDFSIPKAAEKAEDLSSLTEEPITTTPAQ